MFSSKKKPGKKGANDSKSPSDRLRDEAMANARAARERLGEDYIQEMAAILKKQQNKLTPEQARAQILNADADRVAAEILAMLETKN